MKKSVDEKEILLSHEFQQSQPLYHGWAMSPTTSVTEECSLAAVDSLLRQYIERDDFEYSSEKSVVNFTQASYEVTLTLTRTQQGSCNLCLGVVLLLNPCLASDTTKQMFVLITVPSKETEKSQRYKSEHKKFDGTMKYCEDFLILDLDGMTRFEMQLISMDKYARKKVLAEMNICLWRIQRKDCEVKSEGLRVYMPNVEDENRLLILNEDTSNSILLLLTAIYSHYAKKLLIYVDNITSNLQSTTRRNMELSLDVTLNKGNIKESLSYLTSLPMVENDLDIEDHPLYWSVDQEDLLKAYLDFYVTIQRPAATFSGESCIHLLSQQEGMSSVFQLSSLYNLPQDNCSYSKIFSYLSLEETTSSRSVPQ